MSFGDRLRQERQRRLLSQEELAEALGVSRRTIARWEHNLALPRSFAQQQLSSFFGLNLQEFLKELETQTPSLLTLLWTVPFPRNPFFTGREEILHTLRDRLTAQQSATPLQTLALCGLGGIGKTQIALEYAYRYASEYRAVFWLAAENAESLLPSVQQIAEQLQLPERRETEQARMVLAVQRWLATQKDWLLIVDNVEEFDLLETVLPPRREGAVLLTSRHQALGLVAEAVEVPPMSQQESVSLLLARARLARSIAPGAAPGEASSLETPATRGASELVTLLEGLPLAVDQAGAYIEETGCRVMDYLERYRRQRKQILARRGGHAGGHPASVNTTLRLSVRRIGSQHPAAGELLHLCAFLHPEAIPEELFRAGAEHLGPTLSSLVTDPYQFDLALAALRSASLVTRSPQTQTLSLHRLVQAVLQDQMEPAEIRLWSERAVSMVNAAFPDGTFETWSQCERLMAQALACVSLSEPSSNKLAEAAELFFKAGGYLMARGRYGEAEPLLEQAVTLGEQQHDLDQTVLIPRLQRRAQLFWRQGKYGDAESLLHQVLQLKEFHFGPTHLQTAQTLNNLALLYWAQGKYDAAEPLYQQILDIEEPQLGPAHLEIATTLINLANLYWSQGKYGNAEVLYVRALRIREQQLGSEHPDTALTLNNLASTYREQGKDQQAEQLYSQVLRIREQQLGPEHPDTAYTLHNLANVYRDQEKYELALSLYQRARRIREQQLGSEHPEVAETLDGLANLYGKLRDAEEAERLFAQALRIREQQLGSEHPEVAETLGGLANLYRDQGKYEQAEPLYQRALDICEQRLGPDHPKTMKIRNDRGRCSPGSRGLIDP
jgi:tetratricopeptide (TPR) repeat protein/transcriptional regulator with XRE-family HTH domain